MHIAFHDGLFDHGSRLFSSLQESWHNSTQDTSDVNVSTKGLREDVGHPQSLFTHALDFLCNNSLHYYTHGSCTVPKTILHVTIGQMSMSSS